MGKLLAAAKEVLRARDQYKNCTPYDKIACIDVYLTALKELASAVAEETTPETGKDG